MSNLQSKILAASDQQKERFAVCKSCDKYFFGVCKYCGCVLRGKTILKHQTCPIGKWDEIDAKYESVSEK
jgi:hypothetical protein